MVENRERSLGYPGFVTPVFMKESKPLGKKEEITRAPRDHDTRTHLKKNMKVDSMYADYRRQVYAQGLKSDATSVVAVERNCDLFSDVPHVLDAPIC
ncbi:hypothetical protein TNCV_3730461 [Trichonephila clavipes]|uniref:Uncharacterized protein n=1 Tax=Trichonephila clavipes TaxID=2585209 RepID=A0A8X6R9Q8_TRICX|nr:hypothetical protein TNCV_3730461 [Trichonephila clavipes]